MTYAAAREHIDSGDLIAVRSRRGALAAGTRAVCKSPYTHTAVALWMGSFDVQRLLVAQANSAGASFAPLSHYEDTDFDVFACPVSRREAINAVWQLCGRKIRYDLGDLGRIALNRLLGIPLPKRDDGSLICSALSASIYLHAGWQPANLPSIPAPDDVVRSIGIPPKFEVRKDAP